MKVIQRLGGGRPGLKALRKAVEAHPRQKPREPSSLKLSIKEGNPLSRSMGLLVLGAALLAAAFFMLASPPRNGWGGFGLALAWTMVGLGTILACFGLASLAASDSLSLKDDALEFSRRRLFRKAAFSERLSSYLCVVSLGGGWKRGGVRTHLALARLVHGSDPAKDLTILLSATSELGKAIQDEGASDPAAAFAEKLSLPLVRPGRFWSLELSNPGEPSAPAPSDGGKAGAR